MTVASPRLDPASLSGNQASSKRQRSHSPDNPETGLQEHGFVKRSPSPSHPVVGAKRLSQLRWAEGFHAPKSRRRDQAGILEQQRRSPTQEEKRAAMWHRAGQRAAATSNRSQSVKPMNRHLPDPRLPSRSSGSPSYGRARQSQPRPPSASHITSQGAPHIMHSFEPSASSGSHSGSDTPRRHPEAQFLQADHTYQPPTPGHHAPQPSTPPSRQLPSRNSRPASAQHHSDGAFFQSDHAHQPSAPARPLPQHPTSSYPDHQPPVPSHAFHQSHMPSNLGHQPPAPLRYNETQPPAPSYHGSRSPVAPRPQFPSQAYLNALPRPARVHSHLPDTSQPPGNLATMAPSPATHPSHEYSSSRPSLSREPQPFPQAPHFARGSAYTQPTRVSHEQQKYESHLNQDPQLSYSLYPPQSTPINHTSSSGYSYYPQNINYANNSSMRPSEIPYTSSAALDVNQSAQQHVYLNQDVLEHGEILREHSQTFLGGNQQASLGQDVGGLPSGSSHMGSSSLNSGTTLPAHSGDVAMSENLARRDPYMVSPGHAPFHPADEASFVHQQTSGRASRTYESFHTNPNHSGSTHIPRGIRPEDVNRSFSNVQTDAHLGDGIPTYSAPSTNNLSGSQPPVAGERGRSATKTATSTRADGQPRKSKKGKEKQAAPPAAEHENPQSSSSGSKGKEKQAVPPAAAHETTQSSSVNTGGHTQNHQPDDSAMPGVAAAEISMFLQTVVNGVRTIQKDLCHHTKKHEAEMAALTAYIRNQKSTQTSSGAQYASGVPSSSRIPNTTTDRSVSPSPARRRTAAMDDPHRGHPQYNNFRDAIRRHFLRLLKIHNTKHLSRACPALTEGEFNEYVSNAPGRIQITRDNWRYDFTRPPSCDFNQDAVEVFAKDFISRVRVDKWYSLARIPEDFLTQDYVEYSLRAFCKYLKGAHTEQTKKPDSARTNRLHKSAIVTRRRTTFDKRKDFLSSDPDTAKHTTIYKDMGTACVSGDETDPETPAGRREFRTKVPAWRSRQAARFQWRTQEQVDAAAKPAAGNRRTPGSAPRIRNRASIKDYSIPAPKGLPRNCYDPEWLASQSARAVRKLNIKDEDYDFELSDDNMDEEDDEPSGSSFQGQAQAAAGLFTDIGNRMSDEEL